MVRQFRKPLVIMTPKSLLRNKDAGSPLSELAKGVPDRDPEVDETRRQEGQARHRLLGQGLLRPGQRPQERGQTDTAIIRIEQLYPFPHKAFAAELKKFPNATKSCGPGRAAEPGRMVPDPAQHLREHAKARSWLRRPPGLASPAVGYYDKHYEQQKALLETAFSKLKGFVLTK
jgi:2-oxoglutarate dehydrogenase E1 component